MTIYHERRHEDALLPIFHLLLEAGFDLDGRSSMTGNRRSLNHLEAAGDQLVPVMHAAVHNGHWLCAEALVWYRVDLEATAMCGPDGEDMTAVQLCCAVLDKVPGPELRRRQYAANGARLGLLDAKLDRLSEQLVAKEQQRLPSGWKCSYEMTKGRFFYWRVGDLDGHGSCTPGSSYYTERPTDPVEPQYATALWEQPRASSTVSGGHLALGDWYHRMGTDFDVSVAEYDSLSDADKQGLVKVETGEDLGEECADYAISLPFQQHDRVFVKQKACTCEVCKKAGHKDWWRRATVVATRYHDGDWPAHQPPVPFQVELDDRSATDIGCLIYVQCGLDCCIREIPALVTAIGGSCCCDTKAELSYGDWYHLPGDGNATSITGSRYDICKSAYERIDDTVPFVLDNGWVVHKADFVNVLCAEDLGSDLGFYSYAVPPPVASDDDDPEAAAGVAMAEHDDGLRFSVGDRVLCACIGRQLRSGTVVQLNWRSDSWGPSRPSAPYQVKLDDDPVPGMGVQASPSSSCSPEQEAEDSSSSSSSSLIYVPHDQNDCVKAIPWPEWPPGEPPVMPAAVQSLIEAFMKDARSSSSSSSSSSSWTGHASQ